MPGICCAGVAGAGAAGGTALLTSGAVEGAAGVEAAPGMLSAGVAGAVVAGKVSSTLLPEDVGRKFPK